VGCILSPIRGWIVADIVRRYEVIRNQLRLGPEN